MARIAMTVDTRPAPDASAPLLLGAAHAFDNTNGMYLAVNGRTGLQFQNPTVGAIMVTIHSQTDERGRTKDITAFSIPAAGVAVFQEFQPKGWADPASATHNQMNVDASATGLLYLAIQRATGT